MNNTNSTRTPHRPVVISYIVSRVEAGQNLQVFLAAKLGLSRRGAKSLLDDKRVYVNRRCVWMTHHTLNQGDTVEVPRSVVNTVTKAKSKDEEPEAPKPIRILFQDDYYVVADKPSGMNAQGAHSIEELLRAQLNLPGLQAVHRLDRDTTGCMLFAKSVRAFDAAVAIYKTRDVTKIYHAIVWGPFTQSVSTLTAPLDGQRAISHVRREAMSEDATFLRVAIETGRTHQIRRHLAGIRHPILGDPEHGLKTIYDPRLLTIPRQMLHSSEIEMPHPLVPGSTLKAHSPLPADFRRCLKLFGMGK